MKESPFKRSDELVDVFFDKLLDSKKGLLLKIKNAWPRHVGRDLAVHTDPEEVNNGVLYVKVKSSIWRKELKMSAGKLVETAVKEAFPEIKKIVWR